MARAKITSHFKRRCIPLGCVAKVQNILDIPARSRLASRAPQHLKLRTNFCANPERLKFFRRKEKQIPALSSPGRTGAETIYIE